jgi:hypothetical protein
MPYVIWITSGPGEPTVASAVPGSMPAFAAARIGE